MAVNQVTDKILTEWIIETGKSQKEIAELAKSFRAQAKNERNLDTIRKGLNKTTEKQAKSEKKLSASMAISVAKGNIYAKVVGHLGQKLLETAKLSNQYAQAQRIYTGNIERAKEATKGLASELDIMQAANRLNTLGVKLSAEQNEDLLKGVTKLSNAMGITMKEALESATTAMARQSIMVADNLGVTIKIGSANEKYAASLGKLSKDLTDNEKKLAFQSEFLRQVKEKSEELPEIAETVGNTFEKMTKSFENWNQKMMGAINLSPKWVAAFKALGDALKRVGEWLGIVESRLDTMLKTAGGREMVRMGRIGGTKAQYVASGVGEAEKAVLASISGPQVKLTAADRARRKGKKAGKGAGAGAGESFQDTMLGLFNIDPIDHAQNVEDLKYKYDSLVETGNEYLSQLKETTIRINTRRAENVGLATSILNINEASRKNIELEKKKAYNLSLTGQMEQKAYDAVDQAKVDTLNQATNAFSSLGSAMVQAAMAAQETGEGFASAMGKIVKATLKGIAITSAVKALESLALAAFNMAMLNPVAAGKALEAAAMYTGTAILAGSVSAAIPGGGGGGGVGAKRGARGTRPREYEKESRARPTFAKKAAAMPPINIDLYIGDPKNPSSALLAKEQLNAELSTRLNQQFSEV